MVTYALSGQEHDVFCVTVILIFNRKSKLRRTAAIWKTCGRVRSGRCWWGSLAGCSSYWDRSLWTCLSGHRALSSRCVCSVSLPVCAWMLTFLTCLSIPPHPFIHQELVSVGTDGRTGDLSVLGTVKHKMVCSPDFEALLESSAWCLSTQWSCSVLVSAFPVPQTWHPTQEQRPFNVLLCFGVAVRTYLKKKKQHIDKNLFSYCSIGVLVQGWGVPKFITVKITW